MTGAMSLGRRSDPLLVIHGTTGRVFPPDSIRDPTDSVSAYADADAPDRLRDAVFGQRSQVIPDTRSCSMTGSITDSIDDPCS